MKNLYLLVLVCVFLSCNHSENPIESIDQDSLTSVTEVEGYDSLYAQKLGADDYGMKTYVMAFLKDGPNQNLDSLEIIELQRGHMDNINRLAEEGKLVLAGPFYGDPNSDLAGIYIFDVQTIEEAEELTKSDPAVQSGNLIMELHLWYGSAALMETNEIHNKIAKENP